LGSHLAAKSLGTSFGKANRTHERDGGFLGGSVGHESSMIGFFADTCAAAGAKSSAAAASNMILIAIIFSSTLSCRFENCRILCTT
jgi:hypothetical protein